jgi:PqqA peptide cyclase
MLETDPPLAILAEITHRCPLQCPYCSNALDLAGASEELDTDAWRRVLDQAAALGVLQVHFSGGEPLARRDLEALIGHAARAGLYTNLITSGVMLSDARADALIEAGLDHVQISVQDADAAEGDRVAGYEGAQSLKRDAAARVRERGLPLTITAMMHRQNLARLPAVIAQAIDLGAGRLEVAHVQYYGWALANRDALLPTRQQLDQATAIVERARRRLRGRLVIDHVVPDYHAMLPRGLHGWLGSAVPHHHAVRQSAAVPGRRNPAGTLVPLGSHDEPRCDLAQLRDLQSLPWHRLDDGAMPLLRSARNRLGWLQVPGVCPHG